MTNIVRSQSNSRNYEITFIKNHETCTLYSNTPRVFEKWMLALSPKCIQSNVHEKFRFEDTLHCSWASTLFKAFDTVNQRYVALKVIDKHKVVSGDTPNDNLSQQIKLLKSLSGHPFFPILL